MDSICQTLVCLNVISLMEKYVLSILSLYETQMGMFVLVPTQLRTGDTCCDFSMLEF